MPPTPTPPPLSPAPASHENLRYQSNPPPAPQTPHPRYQRLDDYRHPPHGIPLVSFFSGGGGMDLGFEAAGFTHLALIEKSALFCATLRANRDWRVIGPPTDAGDIAQKETLAARIDELGITADFDGVFISGPPCQPFSVAANQRFSKTGANFKRTGFHHATNGNLLLDFIWYIQKYRPYAFLIENVPGLREIDGGTQLNRLYATLAAAGYIVHPPQRLNAASYGVPQQRERLFIIGARTNKLFQPPLPTARPVPCIAALTDIDPNCPNHTTRRHKARSLARYIRLAAGKRDKLGRVDRLDPHRPSKTVIAGGTLGGGRSHLHPYIPRTLSVRECARLQTFPDDYLFTGPSARQFTQVGNAVPPILAAQLAQAIRKSYY